MKKAFDQTVRDLKREVNKKVLKVPAIEQKILDATSNEPWGPHGSLLADIAQATRNYHECQIIMSVIWKRINDTGKNWRHVYKGLTVLEFLVAHGSERVINEIREHAHQIATLSDFQYIDSSGRDQGSNVRKKSQSLVSLVNDKDRIQEVRQKAHANRDKYRSTFSTGGMHRPYPGGGSYGDHYDDDHYHGHYGSREDDRNGYGRDRDGGYRDDDRYGRGDSYNNRDGDRYSRDSDERYNRDGYRNDDYRGSRGNDDYQVGSRNRSIDRDRDRSFEEDDQYSSRSGGGRIDEPSHDDRQIEHKFSEGSLGALPSYEEATREPHNHVQDDRNGAAVQAPIPKAPSPSVPKPSSPLATFGHGQTAAVAAAAVSHSPKEVDAFDEFDPRGSATAVAHTGASSGTDNFGLSAVDSLNSLALVPVTDSATSEAQMANLPSASYAFNQPAEDPFGDSPFKAIPQDNNASVQQQNFVSVTSFPLPPGSISNYEAPPPGVPKMEYLTSFDGGDSLHAAAPEMMNGHVSSSTSGILHSDLTALQPNTGTLDNLHSYTGTTSVMPSQVFQPAPSGSVQPTSSNILPQSGLSPLPASQVYPLSFLPQTGLPPPVVPQASPYPFSQQGLTASAAVSQSLPPSYLSQPGQSTPVSMQAAPYALSPSGFPGVAAPPAAPLSVLSQPSFSAPGASKEVPAAIFSQAGLSASGASQTDAATTGAPAKSTQSKDKFETKSTVWADTLNRGLVNLNISGSKINPLADIGIDFDSINRMEKRKERERSSAAPVSTVNMGKAMGTGSGIGRAGAMGLAAPPNPMMGPGMGMGMGTAMGNPGSMGMGGYGGAMNQPMGMGGMNMGMGQGAVPRPPTGMPPGPGMPGMGYNPMMGMGGFGSQQYGGYR